MEHRRHPQSELKPSMSTHEFSALVESMKAHGFDDSFPILLFENQIVDGWQRYKAALKAGVTPAFRVWARGKGEAASVGHLRQFHEAASIEGHTRGRAGEGSRRRPNNHQQGNRYGNRGQHTDCRRAGPTSAH